MIVECPCCGTPVDVHGESVYPFDDEKVTQDKPIPNLFMIDAEDRGPAGPRLLIMCHACWHRLEGDDGPDMWTTRGAWDELSPVTPYEQMPLYSALKFRTTEDGGRADWEPESYLEYLRPYKGER